MGLFFLFCFFVHATTYAYQGLSLATPFPSIVTNSEELITFDISVRNYDLAPQRVDLEVLTKPRDWNHVFVGGGGVVQAVFVETDSAAQCQLWLDAPKDIQAGTYDVLIRAVGKGISFTLPLSITLGKDLPERLSIESDLPSVKGTPRTGFTFKLMVRNTSAREVMVNLNSEAPKGFQVAFKKRFGTEEIAAIPVGAGAEKDLEVDINPPQGVSEGVYKVLVSAQTETAYAETELSIEIEGQPELVIMGTEGRLSGNAVAGRKETFTITLSNEGTAPARDLNFLANAPRNWEVIFKPEKLQLLPAGESVTITTTITPSTEAITGDYNVSLRAAGDMISAAEDFRITVRTSALWGVVALLIIAAALVVIVLAVMRFGRR